jgi:ribonuclease HII
MNLDFEKKLWKNNKYVFGIDEVGRGPLAGPVVVCCVCISKDCKLTNELLENVNDSKKLNHRKRDLIKKEIKNIKGINFKIVKISEKEIDKINILKATLKAFEKSVVMLEKRIQKKSDIILIDGNKIIPDFKDHKQIAIIKGDSKIFSIALASIIAKEYRDDLMIKYAKKYMNYGFEINKGYGTKKHIECLKKFGCCEIHRQSFIKNILK